MQIHSTESEWARSRIAPQWNIIPDGTITNDTPHKITIGTPLRKNTVIRKNDLGGGTETKLLSFY